MRHRLALTGVLRRATARALPRRRAAERINVTAGGRDRSLGTASQGTAAAAAFLDHAPATLGAASPKCSPRHHRYDDDDVHVHDARDTGAMRMTSPRAFVWRVARSVCLCVCTGPCLSVCVCMCAYVCARARLVWQTGRASARHHGGTLGTPSKTLPPPPPRPSSYVPPDHFPYLLARRAGP